MKQASGRNFLSINFTIFPAGKEGLLPKYYSFTVSETDFTDEER